MSADMDLHDILGDCSDGTITESSEETDKSFGALGKADVLASSAAPAAATPDLDTSTHSAIPSSTSSPEQDATPMHAKFDAGCNKEDFMEDESHADRDAMPAQSPLAPASCTTKNVHAPSVQLEETPLEQDPSSCCRACGNPYQPDAKFCRKCGVKREHFPTQAESSEDRDAESDVPDLPAASGGDGAAAVVHNEVESAGTSCSTSDTESAAGHADTQPAHAVEIPARSPGSVAHTVAHQSLTDSDSGDDTYVADSPASPLSTSHAREAGKSSVQYPPAEMTTVDAIRLVAELLGEDVDVDSLPRADEDTEDQSTVSPSLYMGERASDVGAGAPSEPALPEAATPESVAAASLPPSPVATGQVHSTPATPPSLLPALEATEIPTGKSHESPQEATPAAAQTVLADAPPCESEVNVHVQSSLCTRSISPSSIIKDTTDRRVARQRDAQPIESSDDESVADHDFLFATPDQRCASEEAAAAAASSPRRPLQAARAAAISAQLQRDRLRPSFEMGAQEGSHKRSSAVSATQQLVRELCRGAHRSQEEPQMGTTRASQRRAMAEAAAAFKESSARRLPLAPIPSSSAYEPLGEPEPMRVWHTPDAPGLWIRHDAPRSESPTPAPECGASLQAAHCEVVGSEAEKIHSGQNTTCVRDRIGMYERKGSAPALMPGNNSAEAEKTHSVSTSQANEASRGFIIDASWLEDTPVPLLGPVERAMQSLRIEKAIGQGTDPPGAGYGVGQAIAHSPSDRDGVGQVQVFASLRDSARAKLLGAVAPEAAASHHHRARAKVPEVVATEAAGRDNACEAPPTTPPIRKRWHEPQGNTPRDSACEAPPATATCEQQLQPPADRGRDGACEVPPATSTRERRPEPPAAHCPSLPQVPQLRSPGPATREAPERQAAQISASTTDGNLLHNTSVVTRTGDRMTSPRSLSCRLVSPAGAALPPRAGAHETADASNREEAASAPQLSQLPASPSPVRLRPMPPVMTPEPRRESVRSMDGDENLARWDDSAGLESSTLGNIAQLFDSPAVFSSVDSVAAADMSTATGAAAQTEVRPEKPLDEMLLAAADVAADEAAANCNSCIARAHQQVDQMRRQLEELATSCDMLETMAAMVRAPHQQDHHRQVAFRTSDGSIESARHLARGFDRPMQPISGASAITLRPTGGGYDRKLGNDQSYLEELVSAHEISMRDDQGCLEELVSAHDIAMRAAASQLAALKQPSFQDSRRTSLEVNGVKRLRDWVADMVEECRGRGPPSYVIAGMLEAAVEAIAQGANAPKVQFCNVVEAQLALPHCRQVDLAGQESRVRSNPELRPLYN